MYKYVFESTLALDSCVVIATIKNPKISRKILRFFRRNNSRVVLQEIALNEASRILEISKEKIGSVLKKEGDLKRIVFKPNRRIDDFV
jgi:hypothetical protein